MSAEETVPATREELPTFDIGYRFDDPRAPDEVTVFERDAEDVTATWISADARLAVPLEYVA